MKFKKLSGKLNMGEVQERILKFWKEDKTFEKSVNKKSKGEVVFYDGPPFPTGTPHAGTVLVSFIKDMVARYQTMRGFSVPRRWGWDCHGLPIETKVEEAMGLTSKIEIENEVGVGKFNQACYNLVSKNNDTWKEYVEQMARWIDYDGSYKTMDFTFMESVLWAFKTCYEKGLIYQDFRVTPYCARCETPLSISETRSDDSTRAKNDLWTLVKFDSNEKLNGSKIFYLAWTTTPWTLFSNMALAVNPAIEYALVKVENEIFIAGSSSLSKFKNVFGEKPDVVKKVKGSELLKKTYIPLFDAFASKSKEGAFKIIPGDFIDENEGVGIVHIAPGFGEDDYWACKANNVPLVCPVDEKGQFTSEIKDERFVGRNVLEANKDVLHDLKTNGKAIATGQVLHNYPHCWRCRNPLLYKAMKAWYFNIDKIKDLLKQQNENVNWVPETVKYGRFGNWLDGARDWNISRNRYWSTPIPVWECENCGNREVLGSASEIEKKSGVKLTNLHKQYMDEIEYKCPKCGKTMKRIPEVLDCWFESACVPFAQFHYPFENKKHFEDRSPSDFVIEYTGQIRCWFYYLHVMSVALFGKNAFKNCIVHGTILDKEGKKLSKSSKNYTDPMKLMKDVGTDAYRLYLFRSTAMLMGDLVFDDEGLANQIQQVIMPLYSSVNFFLSYAELDKFEPKTVKEPTSKNPLDKWILAKLYEVENTIRKNMDAYQIDKAAEPIVSFVDGLTNWYIRRSRRRFWGSAWNEDKMNAYETLYYVLTNLCKILAPLCPIVTEELYKQLTGEESVHLSNWVEIPDVFKNEKLLAETDLTLKVITLARSIRTKNNIKNRQPLKSLKIAVADSFVISILNNSKEIICEELNIKDLILVKKAEEIANLVFKPNFAFINQNYKEKTADLIKAVKSNKFEITSKDVVVEIDGKKQNFDKGIILVEYSAKEGNNNVADGNGMVLALDTEIDRNLMLEGVSREIIRQLQMLRKEADFAIDARIEASFSTTSEDIKETMKFFEEKIKQEVLIKEIKNSIEKPDITRTVDISGDNLDISLKSLKK